MDADSAFPVAPAGTLAPVGGWEAIAADEKRREAAYERKFTATVARIAEQTGGWEGMLLEQEERERQRELRVAVAKIRVENEEKKKKKKAEKKYFSDLERVARERDLDLD